VAEAESRQAHNIVLIGYGAMGRYVHDKLKPDRRLGIRWILVPPDQARVLRDELADSVRVVTSVDEIDGTPDFALECAGHTAITGVVPALLERGVDTIVASVGALSEAGVPELLERAARRGAAQLTLVPGAVAGIDALAAARLQGLSSVAYEGRKAPAGWMGTPAEQSVNLAALTGSAILFEGTARAAAALYPKNANVAAMVGLAGLGLDETRVTLIADPAVTRNTHTIIASGEFGDLEIKSAGKVLPDNPKTSMLAALSIVRAVRNRVESIVI
jgi:aspartate dehydrogenase